MLSVELGRDLDMGGLGPGPDILFGEALEGRIPFDDQVGTVGGDHPAADSDGSEIQRVSGGAAQADTVIDPSADTMGRAAEGFVTAAGAGAVIVSVGVVYTKEVWHGIGLSIQGRIVQSVDPGGDFNNRGPGTRFGEVAG